MHIIVQRIFVLQIGVGRGDVLSGESVKDQGDAQDQCQSGGAGHIQPDAGQSPIPERTQQQHREHQGDGRGKNRGVYRLFDGAEKALGGNGKPAKQIGQAEQAQGLFCQRKQKRPCACSA